MEQKNTQWKEINRTFYSVKNDNRRSTKSNRNKLSGRLLAATIEEREMEKKIEWEENKFVY